MLEIGPGGGHALAAARDEGRSVAGVEHSSAHRSAIQAKWGIRCFNDLHDIALSEKFDFVWAINVIEHVYNIDDFLSSVQRILAPHGSFFLSSVNARSWEAFFVKQWWAMFKEHDHVSFPSPRGIASALDRARLTPTRIWTSELPLEFPITLAVSARDRLAERRSGKTSTAPSSSASEAETSAKLARFYATMRPFDPTSRVARLAGMAATVKAVAVRAE